MRWPWKRAAKVVKTLELDFKTVNISKWGDHYEVDIRYRKEIGENTYQQNTEQKFNTLEAALEYACIQLVGKQLGEKYEDHSTTSR